MNDNLTGEFGENHIKRSTPIFYIEIELNSVKNVKSACIWPAGRYLDSRFPGGSFLLKKIKAKGNKALVLI